jgi:hypothetical protein
MRRLTALALGLLLAACAGDAADPGPSEAAPPPEPDPPATATATPSPSPAASPQQTVPDELDFALPALDGGQVVGAELAGQALALWFWTPW